MKDPVANFWGNIECALDQGGFQYILEDLVTKVREIVQDPVCLTSASFGSPCSCQEEWGLPIS